MRGYVLRFSAVLGLSVAFGCSSEGATEPSTEGCTPGQSIACVSVQGCSGAQVCEDSGEAYGPCVCGAVAASGGRNSSGTTPASSGGAYSSQTGSLPAGASGGAPLTSQGGTSTTPGQGGLSTGAGTGTGGAGSAVCAPRDMSSFSYPAYHAAKRVAKACSDTEVQTYYTDCFTGGNCAAFQAGGMSASCGQCLLPTSLTSDGYGPLLKLGSETAYLSATNLSGCIELVGEPDCAKKIQMAQICEYEACKDNCPITDQSSYQAQMNCMTAARDGVCAQVQKNAVCITSSAHAAACSGASLKTQFQAVATVFCQ